ncbi:hypothetical protein AB6B39_05780 [Algimonas porphyrae]|uniref:Uncharacterized protein n=2 Tax=Algimonas porphyrae TaxID=1128113 RepID=A0ABQ5V3M7_9PROT|nr:hypothetical protein GCM10007854_30660 [Algimonas porphyrae]
MTIDMIMKQTVFVLAVGAGLLAAPMAQACSISGGDTRLSPAAWVSIVDTPFEADDRDSHLWVTLDGGNDLISVPAFADGADGFDFMVPADFNDPWVTKPDVTIWLSDGEMGCRIDGLSHEALPKTNLSAMMQASALVADNMRAIAASMGMPEADIRSVAEDGAPAPDGDGVLGALRDATDVTMMLIMARQTASPEDVEELKVMNAFIGQTEMFRRLSEASALNQEIYDVMVNLPDRGAAQALPPKLPHTPAPSNIPMPSNTKSSPQPASNYYKAWGKTLFDEVTRMPETDWREPQSAAHLSLMMRKQSSAEIGNSKAAGYRDTTGTVLGMGNSALSLMGGGGKVAGQAFARWADLLFLQALSDKLVDGIYPGEFVSIDPVGGPYSLSLETRPKDGRITELNVVTRAKGINPAKIAADIANQFAPYGKAAGALGKAGGRMARLGKKSASVVPQKVGTDILSKASQAAADSAKAARKARQDAVISSIESVAKQLIASKVGNVKDKNFFSKSVIPPFEYSPVNILDPGYHQSNLTDPSLLHWRTQERAISYSARQKGRTTYRYMVAPNKWGAQDKDTISGSTDILVGAEILSLSPPVQGVVPGDDVALLVELGLKDTGEANKDLNFEFSAPGFKVLDLKGPRIVKRDSHAGNGWMRTAHWVAYIRTGPDPASYPSTATVSLFDNPDIRATAQIRMGTIEPHRTCIDVGGTEQFIFADAENNPLSEVSWQLSGPGELTSNGFYMAKEGDRGTATVTALRATDGVEIGRTEFSVGCTCSWNLQFDGLETEGSSLGYSEVSLMGVEQFNILLLDGSASVPSLTGQGRLLNPDTISTTIQDGERTYMSGLPVSVNLGSILDTPNCVTPKTIREDWAVEGGRWLVGQISGEVASAEELTSGCVRMVKPYVFWFRIDLGGQKSLKTALENLGGDTAPVSLIKDLLKGEAAHTSLVGQCFPSN